MIESSQTCRQVQRAISPPSLSLTSAPGMDEARWLQPTPRHGAFWLAMAMATLASARTPDAGREPCDPALLARALMIRRCGGGGDGGAVLSQFLVTWQALVPLVRALFHHCARGGGEMRSPGLEKNAEKCGKNAENARKNAA